MKHATGTRVCIVQTGDKHIDQYAGQCGQIEDTREINDGHRYTQIGIRTDAGNLVWVNENEYEAA